MKLRLTVDIDEINYAQLIRAILPYVKKEDIPLPEAVLNAAELVQINLMTVVLGAVLGAGYAICNFLLLGIAVQRAVDSGDPKQGQLIVQGSYTKRLLLMAVVLIIGFKAPCFNGLAVALPQLFPRVVIFVKSLFQSKRKEEE